MAKPKLTFGVDIVSPFGYIAYHVVKESEAFKSCDVEFVPVFLGGIMKSTGNRPPLVIKNKSTYIERQRKRWSAMFNVPISDGVPAGFPVNTINVQRALVAVARDRPDQFLPVVTACYDAFWVKCNEADVTGAGLGKVLASVLGASGAEAVLTASKTDEVKQLLSKNTQDFIDQGAFGLPYFIATNSKGEKEGFWGVDHLGFVIDHLGLDRSKLGGRSKAML